MTLDEIKELSREGEQSEKTKQLLRSCESLFEVYRRISVSEKQASRFSNGGAIDIDRTSVKNSFTDGEILRICDRQDNFLGLGKIDGEKRLIKIYKLFPSYK